MDIITFKNKTESLIDKLHRPSYKQNEQLYIFLDEFADILRKISSDKLNTAK